MKRSDIPKLCIISPYSYPLFRPQCRSPFAGAEVRVSTIAKALAARGNFEVSMVVWDHNQPDVETIDGVHLYAWRGKEAPLKAAEVEPVAAEAVPEQVSKRQVDPEHPSAFRVAWKKYLPKWFRAAVWYVLETPRRIFQTIRDHPWVYYHPLRVAGFIGPHDVRRRDIAIYDRVKADIYLMAGNSKEAAELAFYCKRARKPYIFLTAHDADYDAGYKEKPDEVGVWGPGYLMTYSIANASIHITQNEHQQRILQERYQRQSVVIRNPIDLSKRIEIPTNRMNILWVGKSEWFKQPMLLLDLAEQCPEYQFTMILAKVDAELYRNCSERAASLSNVELLNYVPFSEVEFYFARAKLLVNTSVFEGFPNTFLQAAKYDVPVVSLQVDAGEMLSQHGCGVNSQGSFESLVEYVKRLMADEARYRQMSEHCRDYLAAYHDQEKIISAYEKAFLSVIP